jgi:hypothetical protein
MTDTPSELIAEAIRRLIDSDADGVSIVMLRRALRLLDDDLEFLSIVAGAVR